MKRILLSIFISFLLIPTVYAASMPNLKYKNIKEKDKISYDTASEIWSNNYDKKSNKYFTKTKGFGDFYDYLDSNSKFAFSTNCEYEFIYKNNLIGYSNSDMKFYNFTYINNELNKQELTKEEVEAMFPEYKVITFSDFSPKTNSLKIQKHGGNLKILLLNNTNDKYDEFTFTSGNAKFEKYSLKGFITVIKRGMIEFSNSENIDKNNWYVILVR